jgi:hypothetical protein
MDSLCTNTGVGFLSAGFESALLPCKFLVFRLEHMSKTYGLSTTHGNMRVWHQRQSACVCYLERYP